MSDNNDIKTGKIELNGQRKHDIEKVVSARYGHKAFVVAATIKGGEIEVEYVDALDEICSRLAPDGMSHEYDTKTDTFALSELPEWASKLA